MKALLAAPFLAATLALAGCASTPGSTGFDSTLSQPVSGPVRVDVGLSDDLAARAEGLPDGRTLSAASRLGSGFASGGYLGTSELEELVEQTREDLVDALTKRGVPVSDTAPTALRVTLVDAKNNRPTPNQLAQEPSLDFNSFGAGGVELSAEVVGANGEALGTMAYSWFDTLATDRFAASRGTWQDARRGISRFSDDAAKALAQGQR